MLIMKSGKRQTMKGIELPNQERIRMLGAKESYKFLGVLEADTIKQAEMKEKVRKVYIRRTRKLIKAMLCCRNLFKEINTSEIPFERNSGPFLKWTREELRQMDERARELMTAQNLTLKK